MPDGRATNNHRWVLDVEDIPAEYRCSECGAGVDMEAVPCPGRVDGDEGYVDYLRGES